LPRGSVGCTVGVYAILDLYRLEDDCAILLMGVL
jgi:hypothetical protein